MFLLQSLPLLIMSDVTEVVVGKCNNYCIRRRIGRMGMYDTPHSSRSGSGKKRTLPTPCKTQGDFLSQNFGTTMRPVCRLIR